MSRWDSEAAKAVGHPEDFLNWYYGEYKPLVGSDSVGIDNAVHLWRALQPENIQPDSGGVPEGTLISSRDAGANAGYLAAARDIPDATDRLKTVMADAEAKYGWEKDRSNLNYFKYKHFKDLVEGKAEYDLKTKPDWQDPQYVINGEVVGNDGPGNINYGYLGRIFGFSEPLLTKAAGGYQILTDLKSGRKLADIVHQFNLDSFGDDPRDTQRIRQGINAYDQSHPPLSQQPEAEIRSLSDWLKTQKY